MKRLVALIILSLVLAIAATSCADRLVTSGRAAPSDQREEVRS